MLGSYLLLLYLLVFHAIIVRRNGHTIQSSEKSNKIDNVFMFLRLGEIRLTRL